MHRYDQNGSLREYNRERRRKDSYLTLLIMIGAACGVLMLVGACYVYISLNQPSF